MSDLAKLRAAYGRALGQVRRRERELAELRLEFAQAGRETADALESRIETTILAREDATHRLRLAEQELEFEERRLLQPDSFLRST